MKDRLKVFAKWLREYSEIHDPYTLEEILEMDDEQIKNELNE